MSSELFNNMTDNAGKLFAAMTTLMGLREVDALLERASEFCSSGGEPKPKKFDLVLPSIRTVNDRLTVVSLWARMGVKHEETNPEPSVEIAIPGMKKPMTVTMQPPRHRHSPYWLVEIADTETGDNFLLFSDPWRSFHRGATVSVNTLENQGLLPRPRKLGSNFVGNIRANIAVTNPHSSAAALLAPPGDQVSELEFRAFFVELEYFGYQVVHGKKANEEKTYFPPSIWSSVLHCMFFGGEVPKPPDIDYGG
ncbi:MAG: hypothetical protein KC636_04565 [Myxococcales bacterium]|nr:hypothetical protein [Myxococcales bacterium]